jgi:hypothetical protein
MNNSVCFDLKWITVSGARNFGAKEPPFFEQVVWGWFSGNVFF